MKEQGKLEKSIKRITAAIELDDTIGHPGLIYSERANMYNAIGKQVATNPTFGKLDQLIDAHLLIAIFTIKG